MRNGKNGGCSGSSSGSNKERRQQQQHPQQAAALEETERAATSEGKESLGNGQKQRQRELREEATMEATENIDM